VSIEPLIVALVLLAALMHAAWNALVKSAEDRAVTMTLVNLMCGACAGVVALFADAPAPASWPYLVASLAIHQIYFLALVLGYRSGDLSQIYPIARGLGPLLVALCSGLVLGERPAAVQIAGVAVTSLGILSLASGTSGFLSRANWIPLGYAVLIGLTIAAYTFTDALGVRASGAPIGYVAWLFVLNGVVFLAWIPLGCGRRLRPALARSWHIQLLGGVLTIGAYGIALWCYTLGAVAPIAALRETSVVFAALIGARLLGEPFGRRRVLAATIVAAGVIMIGLRI
jgi:drug/metabolite transporter (DMT)-like permease